MTQFIDGPAPLLDDAFLEQRGHIADSSRSILALAWVGTRLDSLLQHPDRWGVPAEIRAQVVALLEMQGLLLRPQTMAERPRWVLDMCQRRMGEQSSFAELANMRSEVEHLIRVAT